MRDKSILVMNTPENCDTCLFSQIAFDSELFKEGEPYCSIELKSVEEIMYESRPNWCPLKPVPEKKEEPKIQRMPTMSEYRIMEFCSGWNACIDEITGGDER